MHAIEKILARNSGRESVRTGETFPCEQLGEQAMLILEAGGIKPLMRTRFGKK